MSGSGNPEHDALREWLRPKAESGVKLKEKMPPHVFCWLTQQQFKDCNRSDGLWAVRDRRNHFPVTYTEEECLFSAFRCLKDLETNAPEDLVIIKIDMHQAEQEGFTLASGFTGKKKHYFCWLCISTDHEDHMLLPSNCYWNYPVTQCELSQQLSDGQDNRRAW